MLNTPRAIHFTNFTCRYSAPNGIEKIGVRGYIVIVDESKCSLLHVLKLIGVALATHVPAQRAVIAIRRNIIFKNGYFPLESETMAQALQDRLLQSKCLTNIGGVIVKRDGQVQCQEGQQTLHISPASCRI